MITWKKNTYYFDKNGQMYRNRTFSYQGHVYHARNSGALARNTWIDGYYYNSYGQRTGKPFNSSAAYRLLIGCAYHCSETYGLSFIQNNDRFQISVQK